MPVVPGAFALPQEVPSKELHVPHNGSVLRVLATLGLSLAVTFPHGTALIRTADRTVRVRVEIAETAAQLQQGLGGRRTLAPSSGMAFLWKSDVRGRFWMKNTSV